MPLGADHKSAALSTPQILQEFEIKEYRVPCLLKDMRIAKSS